MKSRRTTFLRRAALLSAAAAFLFGVVPGAFAQEQSASPTSGSAELEEVVVTAQKRSERMLDVPVAVATIDSQTLIEQDLKHILQLIHCRHNHPIRDLFRADLKQERNAHAASFAED